MSLLGWRVGLALAQNRAKGKEVYQGIPCADLFWVDLNRQKDSDIGRFPWTDMREQSLPLLY
ncbi:hypothetical protein C1J02_11090 [Sulfitobacter sp. SK011]|nr:hypothetical protein C1J02_11090 [Sulfitobacter sp. SK011]